MAEKGETLIEQAANGLVALARELRARSDPADTRLDLCRDPIARLFRDRRDLTDAR
jgi:hypothetical protein